MSSNANFIYDSFKFVRLMDKRDVPTRFLPERDANSKFGVRFGGLGRERCYMYACKFIS